MSIDHPKGFTMIELVLLIGLSILLAAVFITLLDVRKIPFESAVDKLKHDIRYAQWQAMNRKDRYGVIFDSGAERYSVYQYNESNIIQDPLNPSEAFTVDYTTDEKFKDVDILSVDINETDQIEFDGNGIPYDANNSPLITQGTITLSHDGTEAIITIEPNTGRVDD